MKRSRISILAVLGLALLALISWGLYVSIEFYEETEDSGWSVEALRNPYLAAQRFMTQSGIDVTDVDNLARLDQLDGLGTLFFSDANQVQAPRQLQQLLDWLEAGGTVIYSANSLDQEDDLLLAEFGVEVERAARKKDDDGEDKSLSETLREYNRQIEDGKTREQIAAELADSKPELTPVGFDDEIGDLEIAFDTTRVLRHPGFDNSDNDARYQPFSWSNSESGVHMMQFEVGDGLLTIVSDPGIWTSYRIDKYDHAYLLWLLSSDEGNFATLRSVLRESVWALMLRYGTELLIAAALLIGIALWRLGFRFGRLLPRDLSRRRALGEHFSSVSHYLWQRNRAEYLITPLRQSVLRRAGMTLAGFAGAERERQYELLAERCDLEREAIARAFDREDFNEASFTRTVRLLKHIEQTL